MAIKKISRVTTPFLQSIPKQIERFDAYIYAVVDRKSGNQFPDQEYGTKAIIEPCTFDWDHMSIHMTMMEKVNYGIKSFDDLDPQFFEAIEAAFLSLMYSSL